MRELDYIDDSLEGQKKGAEQLDEILKEMGIDPDTIEPDTE